MIEYVLKSRLGPPDGPNSGEYNLFHGVLISFNRQQLLASRDPPRLVHSALIVPDIMLTEGHLIIKDSLAEQLAELGQAVEYRNVHFERLINGSYLDPPFIDYRKGDAARQFLLDAPDVWRPNAPRPVRVMVIAPLLCEIVASPLDPSYYLRYLEDATHVAIAQYGGELQPYHIVYDFGQVCVSSQALEILGPALPMKYFSATRVRM